MPADQLELAASQSPSTKKQVELLCRAWVSRDRDHVYCLNKEVHFMAMQVTNAMFECWNEGTFESNHWWNIMLHQFPDAPMPLVDGVRKWAQYYAIAVVVKPHTVRQVIVVSAMFRIASSFSVFSKELAKRNYAEAMQVAREEASLQAKRLWRLLSRNVAAEALIRRMGICPNPVLFGPTGRMRKRKEAEAVNQFVHSDETLETLEFNLKFMQWRSGEFCTYLWEVLRAHVHQLTVARRWQLLRTHRKMEAEARRHTEMHRQEFEVRRSTRAAAKAAAEAKEAELQARKPAPPGPSGPVRPPRWADGARGVSDAAQRSGKKAVSREEEAGHEYALYKQERRRVGQQEVRQQSRRIGKSIGGW